MEDIYMFKVEDILARLQNGEDANDIANEMVTALNTANDQFQKEEEAKAKKAAAEAHVKEVQKLQDLQEIIDLMHDFCISYYCESNEDIETVQAIFATLDAKSVNKMIDEAGVYAVKMAEMQNHMDTLLGGIFCTPTVKKAPKKGAPAPETRTADVVIDNFLSSLGLK
jgi:hypothetical protein